jgi:hypothetical protein
MLGENYMDGLIVNKVIHEAYRIIVRVLNTLHKIIRTNIFRQKKKPQKFTINKGIKYQQKHGPQAQTNMVEKKLSSGIKYNKKLKFFEPTNPTKNYIRLPQGICKITL